MYSAVMKKYINLPAYKSTDNMIVTVSKIRVNILQQLENKFLLLHMHHKCQTELHSRGNLLGSAGFLWPHAHAGL